MQIFIVTYTVYCRFILSPIKSGSDYHCDIHYLLPIWGFFQNNFSRANQFMWLTWIIMDNMTGKPQRTGSGLWRSSKNSDEVVYSFMEQQNFWQHQKQYLHLQSNQIMVQLLPKARGRIQLCCWRQWWGIQFWSSLSFVN